MNEDDESCLLGEAKAAQAEESEVTVYGTVNSCAASITFADDELTVDVAGKIHKTISYYEVMKWYTGPNIWGMEWTNHKKKMNKIWFKPSTATPQECKEYIQGYVRAIINRRKDL